MTRDPDQAHADAIREDVARRTVECMTCGGRIVWAPAARKWRHVRGDRLGPTRCWPGRLQQAHPPERHDGQQLLDVGGGA